MCPAFNTICGAVDSCHLADAPTCPAGLINPAMPLLIAGAVASAATAGVLGSTVVIPRLKQLPEQSLQLETVRQKLLAQVRGIRDQSILICAAIGQTFFPSLNMKVSGCSHTLEGGGLHSPAACPCACPGASFTSGHDSQLCSFLLACVRWWRAWTS